MDTTETRHMILEIVAGAIRNAVSGFLVDRRSRNLSYNTIIYYTQELGFFSEFLDHQGVTRIDELMPETIRLYLTSLSEKRNGGGLHAAYRAIRAFLPWAWDEYDLPTRNPISRVKAPRRNTQPLPGVPSGDIAAMVEACKGDPLAIRDKAILLCLADSGVRAFELIAWTMADYEPTTGALIVKHGKGDKSRTVFVGKSTRRAVGAYLRTRSKVRDTSPLFATRDGERFTIQGLRRVVQKRAELAGVKPPGLHDFRRAFALSLLRGGGDLMSLQLLLGHSDLATTRRYLAQDTEDLRAAHQAAGPVERMRRR